MEIGSEKSTSKFMHISMHMHISIIMVPVVNVVFFMISFLSVSVLKPTDSLG